MENEDVSSKIENIIKKSNKNFIEDDLIPFLRIPSISLNLEDVIKAKNFLSSYISAFCEEIKEFKGIVNPLILAKVQGKLEDTLLIYMMYDTQPISKKDEWISNPFDANIKDLPAPLDKLGDCIIARGSYNSKTPLLCFLNIIKILKQNDSLPISLLLLFDGEEEIGSPTLLSMLEDEKSNFRNCIDAYYPSAKQDLSGNLVLKLGYKGILSLTVKVSSENKEPHSAFSGMIPNPSVDLISLLNTIYSNNEFQISSLRKPYELSDEENSIIDNLMKTLDIENIKKKAGIVQILDTNPKTALINYLFKPTFNISTLKSGYLENGSKNFVPNQAICNVDIRFAQNINVDEILNEIQEKVNLFAKKSKSHIELIKNTGYKGTRINKNSILIRSLTETSKRLGCQTTELWPLSPAAAPLSKIQNKLGINFITGGLGIGGYAHSSNEFIQLDSIINTRLGNFYFLKNYAELYQKSKL